MFIAGDGRTQQELNDEWHAKRSAQKHQSYVKALEDDVENAKAYVAELEAEVDRLTYELDRAKRSWFHRMLER